MFRKHCVSRCFSDMRPSRNYRKFHEKCCLHHFSWSQIWSNFGQIWPNCGHRPQFGLLTKIDQFWSKLTWKSRGKSHTDQIWSLVKIHYRGRGSRGGAAPPPLDWPELDLRSKSGEVAPSLEDHGSPWTWIHPAPSGPDGTLRRALLQSSPVIVRALSSTNDWRTLSCAKVLFTFTWKWQKGSPKATLGHFITALAVKSTVNLPQSGKFTWNRSRKASRSNFPL